MKKLLFITLNGILLILNVNAQNHTVHDNTTSVTLLPSGIKSDHISNSSATYKENFSLGNDALKSNLNGIGNTAVGIQALKNLNGLITTANGFPYRFGNYNTALGYQALTTDVNGGSNVAVGAFALKSHQGGGIGPSTFRTATGFYNVAIGHSAMLNASGGSYNIGIGGGSLGSLQGYGSSVLSSTTCDYKGIGNVAVGVGSSAQTTIGRYNVTLGMGSLGKNTITSNNVAIGFEALYEMIDGGMPLGFPPYCTPSAGNIAIGFQAGYNELGANKLYIENSNSATPLIGGDFANDIVGINMTIASLAANPNGKLQVNGNARISGSINASTVLFVGSITLTDSHYKLIYTGGGGVTVTLPSAAAITGREYLIVNHGTGFPLVTSIPFKTGFASTDTFIITGTVLHIVSDGTDWHKIN